MNQLNFFEIKEQPDVFADACIRNEAGHLMMLSVYGRDSGVSSLLARMQLGERDGGLSQITLRPSFDGHGLPYQDQALNTQRPSHSVYVGNPDRLTKQSGRLPEGLYHNMTHTFIFDPALQEVDKANQTAWVVFNKSDQRIATGATDADVFHQFLKPMIWQRICQLSNVPLLEHWMDTVLKHLSAENIVWMSKTKFFKPLGLIEAIHIKLDEQFPELISTLVKEFKLTDYPTEADDAQDVPFKEVHPDAPPQETLAIAS